MRTNLRLCLTLSLLMGCAIDASPDSLSGGTDGKADGGSSSRLGASPRTDGTTFRVWAPNAERVFVTGSFNDWSETSDELTLGTGGVFAGSVAAAKAGNEYLYVIERGGQTVKRADPRAAQMTNSSGNSVIYDQAAYTWKTHDYHTPTFDETTAMSGARDGLGYHGTIGIGAYSAIVLSQ